MNIQDLQKQFPIVDEDGKPSQYFLKYLADRGGNLTNLDAAIAEMLARQIIAGDGLDGGGPLSADVTLTADVQEILDQLSTTHGAILYRDSAAWAVLAPGTSGQVLQTNGASADPSWVTPASGSGSVIYVGRTAFTTASNVDISLPSTYDSYRIEYYFTASTDNIGLDARITTDNFSTVKSGATDYTYTQLRSSATSTGVTSSNGAATIQLLPTSAVGNAANEFSAGEIRVINSKETAPTLVEAQIMYVTGATATGQSIVTGAYTATTTVDGLRLIPTAGTITGFYKVWGFDNA